MRAPPRLAADAHKGDAGRVLCLVGSETMPGAAVLVARAAQRAGAGLVAVGCLDSALMTIVPTAAPEAVLVDLSETFERGGRVRSGAAERLRSREFHALLAGPGLGDDARTRSLLRLVLETCEVPLVLDADALNALDGEPERLRAVRAPVVITPHPGEAARLLGRSVPRDGAGRVATARELALRSGAIACLKGHATVLAQVGAVGEGEKVFVNSTGNAGMATAGAGDVLSGILVAYLAALRSSSDPGWTPLAAAASAVYVHGLAGDLAAQDLGPRALIASDLIGRLPEAQRRLEELSSAEGG
jgi:NAD(P)H-hydrate epimerase